MKTAIITGVAGMDGSYLSDLLLEKDYKVIGVDRRRVHHEARKNIHHIENLDNFELVDGDITDSVFIYDLVASYKPDEIYNLGAMSHVGQSWKQPVQSMLVTGLPVEYFLSAIKQCSPDTKLYQASTSELFSGSDCPETGYTEDSPLDPQSPYAVAKEAAYRYIHMYRKAFGIFAAQGVLFNHEGSRRGLDFVTRKITDGVARIDTGLADSISLGNLDASRDWGHAKDYVRAMWMMLQHDEPDDFVVATGESHTIREFLTEAFKCISIDDWSKYVKQDPRFMRPADVPYLKGNPAKIKRVLGWEPTYDFKSLVKEMVHTDILRHR